MLQFWLTASPSSRLLHSVDAYSATVIIAPSLVFCHRKVRDGFWWLLSVSRERRKKSTHSYLTNTDFWEARLLLFCTDIGLNQVADHLRSLRHVVTSAEEARVNTSDDYAFLGWMRRENLIWVTRDWRRARHALDEGLMHHRPGIVVIDSPDASSEDLIAGIDAFLAMRPRYKQTWEQLFYLSHGKFVRYLPDGREAVRVLA